MTIYGVALLAFCYVIGQLTGELLGYLLGIKANVGGVGFAMLLLILLSDRLSRRNQLDRLTESGILFWNQLYIPIVVAMSAILNVRVAVSSGAIAVLAGIVPVLLCGAVIPLLAKFSTSKPADPRGNYQSVS